MSVRDTQISVEVLLTESNPNVRDTQVSVEVLLDSNDLRIINIDHERAMVISYPKEYIDNNTIQIDHERVMILSKILKPSVSSQVTIIT